MSIAVALGHGAHRPVRHADSDFWPACISNERFAPHRSPQVFSARRATIPSTPLLEVPMRECQETAELPTIELRPRLRGDRRVPFSPGNDREFAEFFIAHHRMAIDMSQEVVERGERADVRELAQRIVEAQTREITIL